MSNPLTDLIRQLDQSTGWVHQVVELNKALQPFRNVDANLDDLQKQVTDLTTRVEALNHEIASKEHILDSVDARITLAEDERKQRVDIDLDDYLRSVDSKKREADAALEDVKSRTLQLAAVVSDKQQLLNSLDDQIADQQRMLSDIQSKVAASVTAALAAAGGKAHAAPPPH